MMFDQRLLEAHCETVKPFVVGLRKRLQEVLGQQWYVFRSLPQGRHVDTDDGNAEVEVFPKGTFLHHFFEVAASGANDADVDGMGGVRAQAFQTAFLQYAQELRLQGQGQVANLVEKDCPGPGLFEASAARLDGTGKGAFFVAKKFVFNQGLGQSAGGERNERLFGTRAEIMDGARHHSFTRPALTRDEHAGKNPRNFVDEFVHPRHRFAISQQSRDAIGGEHSLGRAQVSGQVGTPARGVEAKLQGLHIERLFEEVDDARAKAFNGFFPPGIPAVNDHGWSKFLLRSESHHRKNVFIRGRAILYIQIQQNDVDFSAVELADSGFRCRDAAQLVTRSQYVLQNLTKDLVGID